MSVLIVIVWGEYMWHNECVELRGVSSPDFKYIRG